MCVGPSGCLSCSPSGVCSCTSWARPPSSSSPSTSTRCWSGAATTPGRAAGRVRHRGRDRLDPLGRPRDHLGWISIGDALCQIFKSSYRVVLLVKGSLWLASKYQLCLSTVSLYCGGTLNLMSGNNVPQPDGPPCISDLRVIEQFYQFVHFKQLKPSQLYRSKRERPQKSLREPRPKSPHPKQRRFTQQ